jgi:hypothetical protein
VGLRADPDTEAGGTSFNIKAIFTMKMQIRWKDFQTPTFVCEHSSISKSVFSFKFAVITCIQITHDTLYKYTCK